MKIAIRITAAVSAGHALVQTAPIQYPDIVSKARRYGRLEGSERVVSNKVLLKKAKLHLKKFGNGSPDFYVKRSNMQAFNGFKMRNFEFPVGSMSGIRDIHKERRAPVAEAEGYGHLIRLSWVQPPHVPPIKRIRIKSLAPAGRPSFLISPKLFGQLSKTPFDLQGAF